MGWFDDNGIAAPGQTATGRTRGFLPEADIANSQGGVYYGGSDTARVNPGPLPPGYTQSEVEDYIARNPGVRPDQITAALNDRTPQALAEKAVQAGRAGITPGQFGSPRPIQAFTERFTAPDYKAISESEPFKFRISEAVDTLQKSAASRGKLRAGLGKDIVDRASAIASDEADKAYQKASMDYERNFGVHQWNEGQRYGSERSNLLDQYGMFDRNREFGANREDAAFGQEQARWGRGNTEEQQYYDRLFGLAGLGDPTRAAGANTGFTGQLTDLATGAGNAAAAGQVGSANAYSNAIGSAIPLAQTAVLSRYLRAA